jgi:hypothetical protein
LAIVASVACGPTIDVGANNPDGAGATGDGGATGAGEASPEGASPEGASAAPPTTTVTGSVDGRSIVAKDALGGIKSNGPVHQLWVTVADRAGLCPFVQHGESVANLSSLRLAIFSYAATPTTEPPTIGPGTYTFGADQHTFSELATFSSQDAMCNNNFAVDATGGSITVSEVTAGSIKGSFDLTFSGGSLKGDFVAATCDDTGAASGSIKCAP